MARRKIAVIGAGYFGCTIALALAEAGYEVVLLERLPSIVFGASRSNTNRVHAGFHYPRDLNTAIQCRDNFKRFTTTFLEAIFKGFPNVYCIAAEHSQTSVDEYIRFCDRVGLTYSMLDLNRYTTEIRGCVLGLSCDEAVCDADVLRSLLATKMRQCGAIKVSCGADVCAIEKNRKGYKLHFSDTRSTLRSEAVINCSYSDINRLSEQLGHNVPEYQFEYTVVPIIGLDLPPQGITIMDGPFMTLLPYGKTGKFTLYHVCHSVVETEFGRTMNQNWRSPEKAPLSGMDKQDVFESMRSACSQFVPALRKANLVGFLEGPRMVLAHHDHDDARPSLLQDFGDGYFTVFSGKIDHCLSIAEQVVGALPRYIG